MVTNLYKKLVWVGLGLVLGVSAGLVVNYHSSFKQVYVKFGSSFQLNIYKDLGGDSTYNYNAQGRPLFTISSSQTVKLKKGVYDFLVNDPSHQYENPVTKVVVSDKTSSVTIDPSFTNQKLASLLAIKLPSIQQALLSQYPALPSFYTITPGQLYERGDWYGAVLSPINSQTDKLRVIMERRNGNWIVVAKPQISISIPSNPSIPSNIIDGVDQL